jgi:hypothetical protein
MNVIVCQIFNWTHIYCGYFENKSVFEMKNFKIHMVQIMWIHMVQHIFSFHNIWLKII